MSFMFCHYRYFGFLKEEIAERVEQEGAEKVFKERHSYNCDRLSRAYPIRRFFVFSQ